MTKIYYFLLSCVVIVFDQITKYIVLHHMVRHEPLAIIPGLNFTLAYNTGAAFSFLDQAGPWHTWFFTILSIIMISVLCIWLFRLSTRAYPQGIALSLLLGGATGNFIDRLHYGYVIDWIDVYYGAHHWPDFNVADAAICVGALLYVLYGTPVRKKS